MDLLTDAMDYSPDRKSLPAITDVEVVASYNWLDGKESVILVPGKHPICA